MSLTTSKPPRVLFSHDFRRYEGLLLSELSHRVGVK